MKIRFFTIIILVFSFGSGAKPAFLATDLSPPSKNVIYIMYAEREGEENPNFLLEDKDIIDMNNLIAKKSLKWSTDFKKARELFLHLEINLRTLIKNKPELVKATLYVGQAQVFMRRYYGHFTSINNEDERYQSSKVRWVAETLQKYNVRMKPLVINIDPGFLDLFEAIVADSLSVLDLKGSSKIATRAAWETVTNYFRDPVRILILKGMQLIDIAEVLRENMKESIFPFKTSPLVPSVKMPN